MMRTIRAQARRKEKAAAPCNVLVRSDEKRETQYVGHPQTTWVTSTQKAAHEPSGHVIDSEVSLYPNTDETLGAAAYLQVGVLPSLDGHGARAHRAHRHRDVLGVMLLAIVIIVLAVVVAV